MKNLLDIESLNIEDIKLVLKRADFYKNLLKSDKSEQKKYTNILSDRVILTMFFENSTRTLTSFQMAAYRLGAKIVNWDVSSSSLSKGETFSDTLRCISGYGFDAVVVRHHEFKAPYTVQNSMECPVINAGDSWRAHPSQALLDAYTLKSLKGRIEGLKVAICGDVIHSRVANSNIELLGKMGADIHIIAPPALCPDVSKYAHVTSFDTLEEGLVGCDAVMMLRNQKERMEAADIPDDAQYFRDYGLTQERLSIAKSDAIVLQPGPMNRNVEIADDVVDDPIKSKIFEQMANGLPVRMAIFDLILSEEY